MKLITEHIIPFKDNKTAYLEADKKSCLGATYKVSSIKKAVMLEKKRRIEAINSRDVQRSLKASKNAMRRAKYRKPSKSII